MNYIVYSVFAGICSNSDVTTSDVDPLSDSDSDDEPSGRKNSKTSIQDFNTNTNIAVYHVCGNLSFMLRVFNVVYSDDRDASFQLSDDDVSDGGTDDIDTEAYNSSDIERDEARRKRVNERRRCASKKKAQRLCQECGVYVTQLKTHMRKHSGTFKYNCSECDYKINWRHMFRGESWHMFRGESWLRHMFRGES